MELLTYKFLHLLALMSLFVGLGLAAGARVNSSEEQQRSLRKYASIFHGVGLLVILVSGFGALARLGLTDGLPHWILGKLVIWAVVGGMIAVIKRSSLSTFAVTLMSVLLGGIAAWLALNKPGI